MIPGFLKHFWKTYGSWENVRDNRKDYFDVETERSQECAYEISEAMMFKWLQAEKYVTGGVLFHFSCVRYSKIVVILAVGECIFHVVVFSKCYG